MTDRILKGVAAGAGYFAHYHFEAWNRIPQVRIAAVTERVSVKAEAMMKIYGIPRLYESFAAMLDHERPDFVDIITGPDTHFDLCRQAAERGVAIICQKPLAPTYAESVALVEMVEAAGVRFMVHENWRWQPWYREIKRLIETGVVGEVFSVYFRMRTGDGWGEHAYLARQPFFREYPRLLVYETGVHFIDTFRYLLGEVETVYARLRRLNPVIAGEDSGQIVFGMRGGATALLDANRYNEVEVEDPRFTFGELRLDGSRGHLLLDAGGDITVKPLGQPPRRHDYPHPKHGFAGDSVYHIQRHWVDSLLGGTPIEGTGRDYLATVKAVEACYASAATGAVIRLAEWEPAPQF